MQGVLYYSLGIKEGTFLPEAVTEGSAVSFVGPVCGVMNTALLLHTATAHVS